MIYAVRGATTVNQNEADTIGPAVIELVEALLRENHIQDQEILSVFFTVTSDLDALNPATAMRLARSTWQFVPMLCSQEPRIQGMLPRCIRVLIQWQPTNPSLSKPVPLYLHGAKSLRPDLSHD